MSLSLALRTLPTLTYIAVELGERFCDRSLSRAVGRSEAVAEDRGSAVSLHGGLWRHSQWSGAEQTEGALSVRPGQSIDLSALGPLRRSRKTCVSQPPRVT